MRITGWLAAVALVAGVPGGVAGVAAKTVVRVKAKKHKAVRRARVVRRRAVVVVPVVAPPAIVTAPPPVFVPAPPSYAAYRWLDDADAMLRAVTGSPPDVTFAVDRDARYAWILGDGAVVIAEPLGPFERRWYFFERDVTAPFLVRDVGQSFAFDRGRLAAVYDGNGTSRDWRPGDRVEIDAANLLDRGRQLWFAARDPRPLPRGSLSGWSLNFEVGGDANRWRDNGGWRAYRSETGDDRRRARDDRYRHERQHRIARGDQRRPGTGTDSGDRRDPFANRAPQPGRSTSERRAETAPTRPAERNDAGAGAPMPADRGAPERVRGRPAGERPERRDAAPVAEAPAPALDAATPPPERVRRREVETPAMQAVPAPQPEPERAPPPRQREPEPVAAPAPPPDRAAPPPEPVAAPEPPRPAPPPERDRDRERAPRQADPDSPVRPE